MKTDDYARRIADQFIAAMQEGPERWKASWKQGTFAQPYNAVSGKGYHGGNVMALVLQQREKAYTDPRWLTYKQAEGLGCHVKRGEKATQIQFWKKIDQLDTESGELTQRGMAKYIPIFNAQQVEGLAPLIEQVQRPEIERLERAEQLLQDSGIRIEFDAPGRPHYNPRTDSIHLPPREDFLSQEGFYATAFHELSHATGHESRLGRDLTGGFGSEEYAKEELRAEIASLMIGERLDIGMDVANHQSYVANWVQVLQDDPKEILRAAADAEKIMAYLKVPELEREPTKALEQEQRQERVVETSTQAPAPEVVDMPSLPLPKVSQDWSLSM